MDTLPWVLDHSLGIHMGGMGFFSMNVGWNVKWNRDKFCSSDYRHIMKILHKMIKYKKGKMKVLL